MVQLSSLLQLRASPRTPRSLLFLFLLSSAAALAQPKIAEQSTGIEPPPLAPAVKSLLNQDYLTEAERRDLRIRHGVWEDADLSDTLHRAQAALIRGAWSDASLTDPAVPDLDRAEAALHRGEPAVALDLASHSNSLRATRVAAQSLIDLGRADEAKRLLAGVAARANAPSSVEDAVEAVRALILQARINGPSAPGGGDYHRMMSALGIAREQINKLDPSIPLTEARLLYEKDNYQQATQAVRDALTLNPRLAAAWALMGRLACDSFDLDNTIAIADHLDELAAPELSPEAAILRARARIRQTEGDQALAALAPALNAFPANRELLAVQAAALAARFDFDAAREHLKALDEIAPGTPVGYLETGKAMASARQYDEAAEFLTRAADLAPNRPDPWIELGLSELQAGRLDTAESALVKAEKLDVFNTRAANSLILLRELKSYATIESDHFIVRFKPGIDEVMAAEMPPVLERIYARVTGDAPGGIRHEPGHKTTVELYPDHRWFAVRITGMPALHTIAAATGPVIAMEAPREGPGHMAGAYDWARVVQHEFTHTVTLSRTKNRLPHWFTEASAVYLEDRPRDYTTVQLLARSFETDSLFDLDKINIAFVRPEKPSDRALAYAQGHWMYQYMIERFGPDTPLSLMDLYAGGTREEAAFQQVMHLSRAQFLDAFKARAREQLVSWGMLATPANPSIRELLAAEKLSTEESSNGPTDAMLDRWLDQHPSDPFVLDAAVQRMLRRTRARPTADDLPLLARYADARPVDPLPHKLLAQLSLAGAVPGSGPEAAIPHLEYLDLREQHSAGYAIELARRYLALNDLADAQAKALRATQIAPYDAPIREFAATVALRAGDYDTAERHIRALIALEPDRDIHKQRLEAILKMKK